MSGGEPSHVVRQKTSPPVTSVTEIACGRYVIVTNPGRESGWIGDSVTGVLGRPFEGLYTLRIYDSPSLRWNRVRDIQLVAKYHYWTRFSK